MISHRAHFFCAWGLAAFCMVAAQPSPASAAAATTGAEVALSGARVSMVEKGRIVASFDAAGDVRGMMTVTIDRDARGAVSGRWALVSRYVRDLNADGQVDDRMAAERAALPGAELHGLHREYIDIYEGGTLRGSITGGALTFDVDGALSAIDSLQLAIDGGNLSFQGMKGTAALTASNLRDTSGTGALRLAPATAQNEGVK